MLSKLTQRARGAAGLYAVLLAAALFVACDSEERASGRTDVGGRGDRGDEPVDDTGTDAFTAGDADASAPDVPPPAAVATTLQVEPESARLDLALREIGTVEFTATASMSDGEEVDVTDMVRWTTTDGNVASVSPDGVATAFGNAGGRVVVVATLEASPVDGEEEVERPQPAGGEPITAEANLFVSLTSSVADEGVTPELIADFEGRAAGGVEGAPTWRYPENETVYPAGIQPPLFQWDLAGASIVRLRLWQGEAFALDVWTRADRFRPDASQWTALTQSADESAIVQMSLEGIVESDPAAPRRGPTSQVLVAADADLEGAVYYWQIETGDIMRIEDGATEPTALFPDNATNGTCRGCHSISRDGGRIGFMYNGGGDPRAGMAWVDEPTPPIIPNMSENRWTWMAFDPSGTRAAATMNGSMWLGDITPGIEGGVRRISDLPEINRDGVASTHPDWSPDGSMIAFIDRDPAGVDWSYAWGELMTIQYDPMTGSFGSPRRLVPRGATPETDTVSYPSWSPDSRWLAYSVGPDNRGAPPAHIHLVDPIDGASARLARGAPSGQDVMPRFSPFIEGGYYWLLFYSLRPYGNVTTNKQLWVMAIDQDVEPGVDGSHPAFWLPGQDTTQINITGYWAPAGCGTEGQLCKDDSDCCLQLACLPDEALGDETCQRVECTLPGVACSSDAECCPGHVCIPNLNDLPVCQRAYDE